MILRLVNTVCDSIEEACYWSDWYNPICWQAIWMERIANLLDYD